MTSVSGLPFESFALLSRSIVPPVMYSTCCAGVGSELLADGLGDHVAPASAPDADRQLLLRQRGARRQCKAERKRHTQSDFLHVMNLLCMPSRGSPPVAGLLVDLARPVPIARRESARDCVAAVGWHRHSWLFFDADGRRNARCDSKPKSRATVRRCPPAVLHETARMIEDECNLSSPAVVMAAPPLPPLCPRRHRLPRCVSPC